MKGLGCALAAGMIAAFAACVPATEEVEPRGAAGFIIEPTPTTQGAPFVTADGWTLRFEELVVVATINAYSTTESGASEYMIFDGRTRTEGFVRAMPIGQCAVAIRLDRIYYLNDPARRDEWFLRATGRDFKTIDDAMRGRLGRRADDDPFDYDDDDPYSFRSGPAISFLVRAERDGEVKTLDLGLANFRALLADDTSPLEVTRNSVSYATAFLAAERIFAHDDTRPDDRLLFEPIARADRAGNDDGVISADELEAVRLLARRDGAGDHALLDAPACDESLFDEEYVPTTVYCVTMLEALGARTGALFRLP